MLEGHRSGKTVRGYLCFLIIWHSQRLGRREGVEAGDEGGDGEECACTAQNNLSLPFVFDWLLSARPPANHDACVPTPP